MLSVKLIQDFWTFPLLYFIHNSPKYLMEKKYPKIDHEHPNLYNSKCGADSLREWKTFKMLELGWKVKMINKQWCQMVPDFIWFVTTSATVYECRTSSSYLRAICLTLHDSGQTIPILISKNCFPEILKVS